MITKGLAFVILVYFLIKRFTYIYILLVKHAYIYELTGTSRFCPDNFAKDFFVPKKQKHEMRLTNGLAKNRRTEVLSAFVTLFYFSSS